MSKRLIANVTLVLVAFGLGGVLQPFSHMPTLAQGTCQSFNETGKQVCGRFLEYWTQNGALAQQGLPLTNEFQEVSELNGQTYTVQYFERAVFEKHPENARPYDVLLSQLGTFQFHRKYPGGDPSQGAQPPVGGQPTQPPTPPTQPPAQPQPSALTFSGHGKQVSQPFQLKVGALRWHCVSRNGDNNFIVHVVSATTGHVEAFLANEIGASDTTGIERIDAAGSYVLDVQFDGDWEVTLEQ
ncbi:MAG: polysaccharide biosynthesis protein PslG [Chloroflexia bacterium]|jgi:hypothetical protein|nr:polysaccharide biosynthesis protein PslG [Chloroflexia bacterium]